MKNFNDPNTEKMYATFCNVIAEKNTDYFEKTFDT